MALCPRCRIPLKSIDITTDVEKWEVEVEACVSSCGGIWLQSHDFDADARANILLDMELSVLNAPKRSIDPRKTSGPAACPDCKVPMSQYNWNMRDIFIDNCPKCKGRWFDGGEIRSICAELKSKR